MRREQQVCFTARDYISLVGFGRDNDGVAHNGAEAIYLRAQLDLDYLALGQRYLGVGRIGAEWGVWRDVRAGRDGGWVGEA